MDTRAHTCGFVDVAVDAMVGVCVGLNLGKKARFATDCAARVRHDQVSYTRVTIQAPGPPPPPQPPPNNKPHQS